MSDNNINLDTVNNLAADIVDLLPRFDLHPPRGGAERAALQMAIAQAVDTPLAPERQRNRQTLLLARYYVDSYTADSESATHAKRVLDNALQAGEGGAQVVVDVLAVRDELLSRMATLLRRYLRDEHPHSAMRIALADWEKIT